MEAPHTRRRELGASPLCRGLTDAELDEILAISEDRTVMKGDFVFKQGELADALFFIARGRVEISKDTQVLASLGTGEVLGELSRFGGGAQAQRHCEGGERDGGGANSVAAVPQANVGAMKIVCNLSEQITEGMVALNEKLIAATKTTRAAPPLQSWKL